MSPDADRRVDLSGRQLGARSGNRSPNGALGKQIRFVGRAAHAGGAPQPGINALNAAMIAMNAIAAYRETSRKGIRFAFI